MRAHFNPTRMKFIGKLGENLARRLLMLCPDCGTPGWGKVDIEIGLPCNLCELPTDEIKAEIFGCTKCHYKISRPQNIKMGQLTLIYAAFVIHENNQ